jgi:hypothetical protein
VLTGAVVILILKIAVGAVTALLLTSIVALLCGNYRLHGRVNTAFFILTMVAVFGLEVLIRFVQPQIFHELHSDPTLARALFIHLCFSIPSAVVLPFMLYTGRAHRGVAHRALAVLFGVLWTGTFVTGIFFLPHTPLGSN